MMREKHVGASQRTYIFILKEDKNDERTFWYFSPQAGAYCRCRRTRREFAGFRLHSGDRNKCECG